MPLTHMNPGAVGSERALDIGDKRRGFPHGGDLLRSHLAPILPPECLKSTKLRCYQAAVVVIASARRGTFWHLELMSAIAICVSHNTAGSSHSNA